MYQNEEKYQRHLQTCFTPLVKAWQTGHLIEEKTLGTINAAINSTLTIINFTTELLEVSVQSGVAVKRLAKTRRLHMIPDSFVFFKSMLSSLSDDNTFFKFC